MHGKKVFVYPCNSYVGNAVAQSFAAAGLAVSGVSTGDKPVPPSVTTSHAVNAPGAAAAHKQLLLTADVVVYDMFGNEKATRDAVVQLAQQPFGGREVLFVAVSSPLVWAATRPTPDSLFNTMDIGENTEDGAEAGGQGFGGLGGFGAGGLGFGGFAAAADEAPWAAGYGDEGTGGGEMGEAGGDGEEGGPSREPSQGDRLRSVAPTFSAPEDVARRTPAVTARATLATEHIVMRAGRRGRLRTAVVCPGLLYGEGEDDNVLFSAFKAAWELQCTSPPPQDASTPSPEAPAPPKLTVYGRGTNVLPTLHVADLASYILHLSGLAPPPPPPPPPATLTMTGTLPPGTAPGTAPPGTAPPGTAPPGTAPPGSAAPTHTGSLPTPPMLGSSAPSAAHMTPPPPSLLPVPLMTPPSAAGTGTGTAPGGGRATAGTLATAPGTAAAGAPPGSALPPPPSGGYFLVTDGSRCSQEQLLGAIAAAMGLGASEAVLDRVPEAEYHLRPTPPPERLLLDFSFTTTPIPPPPPPPPPGPPGAPAPPGAPPPASTAANAAAAAAAAAALAAAPSWFPTRVGGLPANAAAVAAEFCSARRLQPLRILVMGPPMSGKTHLAHRLAYRYGLAYISVPLLLAAASDPAVAAAAGLSTNMDPALLRAAQAEMAQAQVTMSGGKEDKKAEKEVAAAAAAGGLAGWVGPGRVTARTLGALLAAAVSEPRCRARCRGFVLDGFPRSAGQAKAAFFTVDYADQAAAAQAAALEAAANAKPAKGAKAAAAAHAPSTPAPGSGGSDSFEVPPLMKLFPNPLTAPTHVLELAPPEAGHGDRLEDAASLKARLAAIEHATEEAFMRLHAEPSTLSDVGDKKGGPGAKPSTTKGGARAKDGTPPPIPTSWGHNNEPGFLRRINAYNNWRAEDAADLAARVAAAQETWEKAQAEKEAERQRAEAEANTLKAKRRRARAAAAAAAAEAEVHGALIEALEASPNGVIPAITFDDNGNGTQNGEGTASGAMPEGGEGPALPKHGGLPALCVDAGAEHTRLANPNTEEAPWLTLPVLPPPLPPSLSAAVAPPGSVAANVAAAAAAAAAATAAPSPWPLQLQPLERSVEGFLGDPRHFDGFPPQLPKPSDVAAEAEAAEAAAVAAAQEAARAGAEAAIAARVGGATAAVDKGMEDSYQLRLKGGRADAVRRYLLSRVMPVITAALTEVAVTEGTKPRVSEPSGGSAAAAMLGGGGGSQGSDDGLPLDPNAPPPPPTYNKEALMHVARALRAAAEAEEARFTDPYMDASYSIQLEKIDAKKQREAARAAAAVAKAEREAAARAQAAEAVEEASTL
ncbi:hypothetical protein HYH03_017702 [Edaphochlamys debaryana]|uniref:adenylate kinase n=1 Tax=Edaphochlamys debaryana TaxID=47281 RepID=A0A836BQC0_9CHLO|nr:hypothetical protein HYH03_017702 [Edaphochlamys debaryana]|eukprot:KAG2483448.1 hypothetical protein HYH03_017702 [Edaphochlamys debaryana]